MGIKNLFLKRFTSKIGIIVLLGLLARVVFTLFFAKAYYGTSNIYYNYDSGAWALCFQNLLYTDSFTIDPGHPLGYFVRMPGYSFFLGVFYLLCSKDWITTFFVAGWFHIALDALNIYLLYRITYLFSNDSNIISGDQLIDNEPSRIKFRIISFINQINSSSFSKYNFILNF